MHILTKSTLLTLTLVLGACQNADRFGPGGPGTFGPGGTAAPGLTAPPNSPAYFREAVGDRVHFAVDQSTLSSEARATLDAQAAWLSDNPEYAVVIEGHADEQGTREYNIGLSNRRATAAQEYLVSRGVSPARLRTVGYGKERPIEVCSTEDCYRQNRRAVTVLAAGAGV